jgi:hypothetical protein
MFVQTENKSLPKYSPLGEKAFQDRKGYLFYPKSLKRVKLGT